MTAPPASGDFTVIDPSVAAEVKVIADQRPGPFSKGNVHPAHQRSARTQALIDGATVFIPGDKPTRNWSGWYRRVMKPRGLRVRQLYAEYKGQTGHFVWAQPIEGKAQQ